MNNQWFSKVAVWLVIALVLFTVFKQFDRGAMQGNQIGYSEFLDEVQAKRIKFAVLRDQETVLGQCLLKPLHGRHGGGVQGLRLPDLLFLGPQHQAFIGQAFPGEQWAGIDLALRCNVAVAEHAIGPDLMALDDVAHQLDHQLHLFWRVGLKFGGAAVGAGSVAQVHDLDADGVPVEHGMAVPRTDARVPGPAILIHQTIDARALFVGDEVMR